MSEQEKKSSANITGGSSVVMVEQTTASRHKQPYRPTELQEETGPDVQHKRSRAPAVPSLEEELKDSTDTSDSQGRRGTECTISCEKQKQSIAKKLSMNTKRRGASPEAITLAPVDIERMRDLPQHTPQPIPAAVSAVASNASTGAGKLNENNDDDDSITEEIADLRTPEVAKKSSEWNNEGEKVGRSDGRDHPVSESVSFRPPSTGKAKVALKQMIMSSPNITRKKDISWEDEEYRDKVSLKELGARSQPLVLERRASVGPCFRAGMPLSGPSGITIYLPRKSSRNVDYGFCSMPSGINISISKKNVIEKSKSCINDEQPKQKPIEVLSENNPKKGEDPFAKFFCLLRGTVDNARGKIKNVFNM